MLSCVQMDVRVPEDLAPASFEQQKAGEKRRAGLRRADKWLHLQLPACVRRRCTMSAVSGVIAAD
jgi:muconolactone delta-isomerase